MDMDQMDIDQVTEDADGNLVIVPCESTVAIIAALDEFNRTETVNALRELIPKETRRIMMKDVDVDEDRTDFAGSVVDAIKEDAEPEAIEALFTRSSQTIGTWRNDPEQRYTFLHFAARYDRPRLVYLALRHGCSLSDRTFMGSNAIHYASMNGACDETMLRLSRAPDWIDACNAVDTIGNVAFSRSRATGTVPDGFKELLVLACSE